MARPDVSMLNVPWRSPLAAMSVVSSSSRGVDFYASGGVHMVVDVAGWFLGAPVATTSSTASGSATGNLSPSSGGSVLFVSDSSLAGIAGAAPSVGCRERISRPNSNRAAA
jgi:hypothetical protein